MTIYFTEEEMKKIVKVLLICILIGCLLGLTACNKDKPNDFGLFAVAGKKLTELSCKKISFGEAKELLSTNYSTTLMLSADDSKLTNDEVFKLKRIYKALKIEKIVWNTDSKGKLVKDTEIFEFYGKNFEDILTQNCYSDSIVKILCVICKKEMLQDYQKINDEFKNIEALNSNNSEFSEIFTYHKSFDSNNREVFVLQTHTSSDMDNTIGGVPARFIQECEYLFDLEGKITNFQCSLGVKINNPKGTYNYNGSNIELIFHWQLKN